MTTVKNIFVNEELEIRSFVLFDPDEDCYSVRVWNFAGLLLSSCKLRSRSPVYAEHFAKICVQLPGYVEKDETNTGGENQ